MTGHSPVIARMLQGCTVEAFSEETGMRVGELLAASRTSDVVDAAVVLGAAARGDRIVTSDPEDIDRLIAANGGNVTVLAV